MHTKKETIVMGVITQLENDLNDLVSPTDYSALDEMLTLLIKNKKNEKILLGYLGDDILERIHENKLEFKY